MHVEKTSINDTEISLTILATGEELLPIKNLVLKKLAKNVKAAGFREGKVPLQLAEKYVDPAALQTEFLDEAMTQLYAKATEQEHVRPATQPKVDIKKFVPFTTLEYVVTTGVFGPVSLGDYKGLKIDVQPKKVTDADVEKVLESLRERSSERKPVDRSAKKGDEVSIDFKGADAKGNPISGADGTDYPLMLGSGSFIPGFEDNLVGLKQGEEKTFTLTFPKDYGVKALASKKVTFTATVKTVSELTKPELTEDFISKIGPFKTVEELKADIRQQLEHEAHHETERAKQNQAVELVSKTSSVKIPQALIDQQAVYELDELRRNLTYRGQTYQEFLEMEGSDEDKYKKDIIEPRAEEQVKIGVLLSEIAEREGIEVTPEELEQQMQALKAQYKDPAMQQELDKFESRRDIASRMLSQKVVNFLVENSK